MRRRGFSGVFRVDMRRALGLPFWICALLIAAVHIRAVSLSFMNKDYSVVALYNESVTIENYMQSLLPVLVSAVFSTAFLDDLQSEYYRFQLLRSRWSLYLISKIAACVLSAFLCMWLGLALFLAVARCRFPLLMAEDIDRALDSALELNAIELLQQGRPAAYLLTAITLRSIAMIFWPLCAMSASVLVLNRFVVLGTPWLIKYAIGVLDTYFLHTSYGARFSEFTTGSAAFVSVRAAIGNLLVRYLPCMALCVICCYCGGKRRLKNG